MRDTSSLVKWTGDVTLDGKKLRLHDEASFRRHYSQFAGQKIELTIQVYQPPRSDAQHKYWHGCVVPILAEYCGYTTDEMHEALKQRFLSEEDANGLTRVKSTRELSRSEFVQFVETVCQWAAEMGCVVPPPR